jgi:hypothetical protein
MPQEIVKDWLRKIKIHKIKKFNSIFSTNQGLISKENSKLDVQGLNWNFSKFN